MKAAEKRKRQEGGIRTSSHSGSGRHISITTIDTGRFRSSADVRKENATAAAAALTQRIQQQNAAAEVEAAAKAPSATTDEQREQAAYLVNLKFKEAAGRCPRDLSHPVSWVVEVVSHDSATRMLTCISLSLRAGSEFTAPYENFVTIQDETQLTAEQIKLIAVHY